MNRFTLLFSLVLLATFSNAQTNFRTNGTGGGLWSATSTWQVENPDGSGNWFAAVATPTSASGTIEIRANDVVTVSTNVTIDQTTIDANGNLTVSDAIVVTLAAGANSLVVNGTLNMLGESNVKGSGSLVVNGSLIAGSINSTGAIVNGTSVGNIRNTSANRTYNSGSQIIYAGTSAQIIGSGHPVTSGVVTVINNAAGVSFSPAGTGNPNGTVLTIPGDLILTSGDLNIVSTTSARSLTLNGNITANSNHITITGTTSSLTINGSGAIGTFPFPSGAISLKNLSFGRSSGSVTFNNALTLSGTLTLTNGTITLGGTTSVKGTTTLSAGTVLAFDGQSLSLAGDFSSSGLLSASGASSLSLTGATALTSPINFVGSNKTLQALTINKSNTTGTSVKVGASGLKVTTTLTLTDGVFDISNGLDLSSGSVFNFGATGTTPSSISQTPTGGPWTLNYSGSASRTTGPEIPASGILNGLSDASSGMITLGQSLTLGASGFTETAGRFNCGANSISTSSLTIASGTFTAPSTTLTITGDLTVGGTYSNNSGTLVFNGSTPQSIIGSKASTALFYSIKINNGATLNPPSVFNVRGNFTNNGTFIQGSSNVIFGGSAAQSISGSNIQFYDLTVNKSTNPVTVSTPIVISDTLTLQSGSISNASNKITMGEGSVISRASGTITGLSPLGEPWSVVYTGGSKTTAMEIPSSGNVTSLTVSITSSSNLTLTQNLITGALAISSGSSFTGVAHNITASSINNSGAFVAPSGGTSIGLTLNGDLTNNGTFNAGTGTVVVGNAVNFLGTVPTFYNLSISASGSLVAPSILTIQGNFKNDGTFTPGAGTVIFSGDKAKQIIGSAKISFNNVTVVGGAAGTDLIVENTAGVDLYGILNIDASTNPVIFDTDGSSGTRVFTVKSSFDRPTSDGSIGILSSGSTQLPGKITVERYMGRSGVVAYQYQVWRDISSPVNTTVSDLQNSLPVTGPFTNSSVVQSGGVNDGTVNYSTSSLLRYDETVITDTNGDSKNTFQDGWTDFPADNGNSATTFFAKGQGYLMFIYGSDDPVQNTGNAKWSLRGQIWSGSINLPVTYTPSVNAPTGNKAVDGWNLVGNPYPSTIYWESATGWTKTNMMDAIYIDNYNTPTGAPVRSSYVNGVSANGGSPYIAMGQGFYVRANQVSPSLTINENAKAPGTQTNFFRQAAPQDLIRVTLASGDQFKDETVIYFNEKATSGLDDQFDAAKLSNINGVFNLSTISEDNNRYAINAMPFDGCAKTVSLNVSDVKSGTYFLLFSDFESLSSAKSIQLKDNFTNAVFDVTQNQNYVFTVDANNPATFGSNRFAIVFTNSGKALSLPTQSLAICDASQASVLVSSSSSSYSYSLIAQDGSTITSQDGTGNDLRLSIPNNGVLTGVNQFSLRAVNKTCAALTSEARISMTLLPRPTTPQVTSGTSCGKGTVKLTASGASSSEQYNWYPEVDASVVISSASNTFTVTELTKSKTFYVSISNDLGCESPRVALTANVVNLDPASIVVTGINTLQSNYDIGNQWYVDGTAIAGATDKTLTVTQTGDYKLVVSQQGCSTWAERSMAVVADGSKSEGVSAYPNPIKGNDNLTIKASGNSEAFGELYNVLGQKLSTVVFNSDGQNQSANYYFSQENSGVYFLRVVQGNKISVFRIVKE